MSKKNKWAELAKWWNLFGKNEITAEESIKLINPGQKIFIHSGCMEPQLLMNELINQSKRLKDIEIHHFLSIARKGDLNLSNKPEDLFRHNAFFIGGESIREAVNSGQADYTPMFLSEIPEYFRTGQKNIDVAIIQVSPPDKNNFCSFGVNVDVAKPIAESAELVIAEVNPQVPRVLGNSFIHMKKIDYFVYNDEPLLEYHAPPINDVHKKIAKNVAGLIDNGSTLQIGMGKAPMAVLSELDCHKDLGIHSDTIFDGLVDLVEEGVITCEKKEFHPNRIIANYGLGTKKLFDFVNDNLLVEFHPADYTNNPINIAKNYKMTAVNGAISIDLMGQINADSIGPRFYSSIGGLVDFCRGAKYAERGKSIICLPSTAKDGSISRIVPTLKKGSHVSLTMGDVDYIVTEYGIANLHGKNIRERVMELISIAHPKFRKNLLKKAKKLNYIYSDQKLPTDEEGNIIRYPEKYKTTYITPKGEKIRFRPIHAKDERLVQDLYYSLDDKSRIYRFFRSKKYFMREDVKMDVLIDFEKEMVIVGVVGTPGQEKIVSIGSYEKQPNNFGELAFTVADGWRNKGITTFMLQYLIEIAQNKGLSGFQGEILWENRAMIHIIKNCGYNVEGNARGESWVFSFPFEEKKI
ncbi:MAG: GNAT family N-acetyltransferase [Promethearchaeia archaeon]